MKTDMLIILTLTLIIFGLAVLLAIEISKGIPHWGSTIYVLSSLLGASAIYLVKDDRVKNIGETL